MKCPRCQKAKKSPSIKVPLKPLPVLTEPFEQMAFYLVGPITRSREGYQSDHKLKHLPKEIRKEKSKVNARQVTKVRCIVYSKCQTSFKSEVHNTIKMSDRLQK